MRLKQLWFVQKGVHRQQPSERVAHENAIGLGSIGCVDTRNQFVTEKCEKGVASPATVKRRVVPPGRSVRVSGWCQVTGAVGVGYGYNNELRNL
jgi:hypothetical protein